MPTLTPVQEEKGMITALESLRRESVAGTRLYALSNGKDILGAYSRLYIDILKEKGFWVCSIFENGAKVEV
jgi:hypothetical protein